MHDNDFVILHGSVARLFGQTHPTKDTSLIVETELQINL